MLLSGKLIQVYQGLRADYTVLNANGDAIASADIPQNLILSAINYMRGRHEYKLCAKPINFVDNMGKKYSDRKYSVYHVFNAKGVACGHLCQRSFGNWFKPLVYHEIWLNNICYRVYAVGKGKEGMKYPIFELVQGREVQIGLIEKPAVVIDMRDEYNYYVKDEYHLDAVSLFILYYDYLYHGNSGVVPIHSKEVTYCYTTRKKLLEKYDPEFIRKG